MNNICVYLHVNPIKQEIFYVGIGINTIRPYRKGKRTNHWRNIVKKYGYQIIIIHDNLTYQEASELEVKYIAQIGRYDKGLGPLANMTDGGDGIRGHIENYENIKIRTCRLRNQSESKLNKKEKLKNAQIEMEAFIKTLSEYAPK